MCLRPLSAALLVATLSAAPPARADGDAARARDAWSAAGVALGALALDGAVAARWRPKACRICGVDLDGAGPGKPVGSLDDAARDLLLWTHPGSARVASDVLANVAVPILAGADAVRATGSRGGDAGRDVLVVAEAA